MGKRGFCLGVVAQCLVNWTSESTAQTKARFFLTPTLYTVSDNVPVNDAVAVKMGKSECDLSQIETTGNGHKQN